MNLKALLQPISTFIFDVDGVLSDGSVWTHPDGAQIRRMNIKDGYAIQHAVKKGYNIIIISGGSSESVRKRLSTLGVKEINLPVLYPIFQMYPFCGSFIVETII